MKRTTFEAIKDGYMEFMGGWKNKHHRFRSYDPCKNYFDTHYGKDITPEVKDEFCLRLFNYLASWGMFRGNDWFIWKSYGVFEDVAEVIFDTTYSDLLNIDPLADDFNVDIYAEKVYNLYKKVRTTLLTTLQKDDEKYKPKDKKENSVSPLMTCKILMGTYGCVIAYDSYDMKGLRALGVRAPQKLEMKTLLEKTYSIIDRNRNEFKSVMKDMEQYPVKYTAFKVLDMILWEYGKDH